MISNYTSEYIARISERTINKDILKKQGENAQAVLAKYKDTAKKDDEFLAEEEAKRLHYQAEIAKESGEITEAEYYNRIETIADQLDRETELWERYNKEVVKGRASLESELQKTIDKTASKVLQSAQKSAKEEVSAVEDNLKDLVNTYKKKYDDIIKLRDDYKKSLMGGSIFNVLTETDKETGETTTTYTIRSAKKILEEREKYAKNIAALEKRGISKSLLSDLESQDSDKASVFAEQMAKMSDKEFNELNDAYKKLDETTTQLANDRYSDELESLEKEFVTKANALFYGMSADMKNAGMAAVQAFISGFDINNENAFENLNKSIADTIDSITNGISSGTVDLSNTVAGILAESNAGESLVENILNSINNNSDSIAESIQAIFDKTGLDMSIKTDMQRSAAEASRSGYAAASVIYAAQPVQSTASVSAQSAKMPTAIPVKLILTASGERHLAEIVNEQNGMIMIQGGT